MHWLQRHWHRITPLHLILLPLSLPFHLLAVARRALYRYGLLHSVRLPVPVVVVGNISVGGTGKTPLTLALVQRLAERGRHPLIVSRGYGGTNIRPQPVGADSMAQQIGDEPLLMARRNVCPVWVGQDRAATAQAALLAHPQCDVVLCDDGLQHYRLQRDFEIAVTDGIRGFGNGFMLPAGPLREPVARLRSVDAVVVNGQARSPLPNPLPKPSSQSSPDTLSSILSRKQERRRTRKSIVDSCGRGGERKEPSLIPAGEGANESLREFLFDGGVAAAGTYAMHLEGTQFYNLQLPGRTAIPAEFYTMRNHAVAGIGNPQRFFQHLETLGLRFTPHAFPDHHPYRADDLTFADCDAILLTEKDAVKCAVFADARFWVLRVEAQFDPSLTDLILRKINPHGPKTA